MAKQINIAETGKRLTLYELLNNENWNVEIPIIQRDYAQGRPSATEVRKAFVSTLYEHLLSEENINLDFVYGSLKEEDQSIFIPLDGQQRLTTLFLLHWYLAQKENSKEQFIDVFCNNEKSRFTYETRTSSREFCDVLVANGIDFKNLINDTISATIENAAWFYLAWNEDSTIKSMLSMLDEIHEQFKETENIYSTLLKTDNPVITFQFLNLDAFKLTDDLYIKMNARGKQLTPFENFKAKFEQHIKSLQFLPTSDLPLKFDERIKQVPVSEYFSFKIDTDWANLFWNYKSETTHLFDEQMMNFIRIISANAYALSKNPEVGTLRILTLKGTITFSFYEKTKCLEPDMILSLIGSFDLLQNGNEKIKRHLANKFYYDEDAVFEKAIANNLSYTERLRFYSLYHYLLFHGHNDGIEEWMRVIYNLTENTIFNEINEFATAIITIENMLPHSGDILKYLAESLPRLSGFLELQVQEEILKACLLQKDTVWRKCIIDTEKHGYYSGQISFLLSFSEIDSYYKRHNNCNWSDAENETFLISFKSYKEKADAVFNQDGLKGFEDSLFERALLSKGDYTLYAKSNHSFLINRERDISWKRLLRDDNNGKRQYVKNLFDDAHFKLEDVQTSLLDIIESSKVIDWRIHFIELPEMLAYLGTQKFIRRLSDIHVYLLKKERLSGPHAECYSYALYLRYLMNLTEEILPFRDVTHIEANGDFLPYIRVGGWEYKDLDFVIDISTSYFPNINFRIEFFDKNKNEIPIDVLNVLLSKDFSQKDARFEYEHFCDSEESAFSKLISLCDLFQKLLLHE